MGCPCAILMDDAEVSVALAAEEEVRRIESRYSRYRDGNLMAEINAVARRAGSIKLDAETGALIDYAFSCYRASSGDFDITTGALRRATAGYGAHIEPLEGVLASVGMRHLSWTAPILTFLVEGMELDFGGIAKEYAADQAVLVCAKAGKSHCLVDLGGDLAAGGPRRDGSAWEVYIRDPRGGTTPLARYPLLKGGLATSGNYERTVQIGGHRIGHLVSPATGRSSTRIASVSVVAASCLLAGSLTSFAMLRNRDAAEWLSGLGVDFLLLTSAGELESDGSGWLVAS